MIYNKLKELGHKATNGYEDFISAFNDSKLVTLFDADLKNFLLVSIISTQSTSARSMLPLLMYLFPNVQEIIHRFENAPPIIQNTTVLSAAKTSMQHLHHSQRAGAVLIATLINQ